MTKAQRGTCEEKDSVRVGQALAEVCSLSRMKGLVLEAYVDLDLDIFLHHQARLD